MPVLDDYDAACQPPAQDLGHCLGHRSAGFAPADDQNPLESIQVIGPLAALKILDDQTTGGKPHMSAYRSPRLDGIQSGAHDVPGVLAHLCNMFNYSVHRFGLNPHGVILTQRRKDASPKGGLRLDAKAS
jgi:hypothetical protein